MNRSFPNRLAVTATACLLALLTAFTFPLRVFAQASDTDANNGKYISEVKIGMGKDAAAAAAALDGYTILSDENKAFVDINQGAGGGFGSKGEKVVYLGYKTTNDSADAITDLAVMNMKGGYSVQEYDALMDMYIKEQIDPLLDRLIAAIGEYRVNYGSQNESNRQRAEYIHNVLNKFIDDDTGKGLGDLLLNPTKYEMGDEEYVSLSDARKNNTADIVTIFAQANGKAVLLLENLLTRAADASDDTWVDRFTSVTYDDMVSDMIGGSDMFPTDAENELARLYDDDARKVLTQWDDFAAQLSEREEAEALIERFDADAAKARIAELDAVISDLRGRDELTPEESAALEKASYELEQVNSELSDVMNAIRIVTVYYYLEQIEYGNNEQESGTLCDFFSRRSDEVDIREIYPIAASFSEGQKAGLDFISLSELVIIAMTDGASYRDSALDKLEKVSIYSGVNREIYKKGGVALTSEALRVKATELDNEELDEAKLSAFDMTVKILSAALIVAAGISGAVKLNYSFKLDRISDILEETRLQHDMVYEEDLSLFYALQRKSSIYGELALGLTIAGMLIFALSLFLTIRDMEAYYNVEFTPIPHYMVDEKDITVYNAKGEKTVVKNQTAYYKAVECSRAETDEMFGSLGTCADLGGDVGRQWLALYAAKNEVMAPILAESLKAVVGSSELPANYTTGIHMFGSGSAANLNDPRFVWNAEAPSVYVYFSADDAVKRNAAGSVFSGGLLALCAAAGIAVGAAITYLSMLAVRKKEDPILE